MHASEEEIKGWFNGRIPEGMFSGPPDIAIAREAEHRFRKKVSWGATCGDLTELFTTLSIPVMTRLRMPQREVLDTLVNAGVARSRSHALAWCVKLVAENEG